MQIADAQGVEQKGEKETRGLVWRYRFHDVKELGAALEEYAVYHESAKVRRYADPDSPEARAGTEEEIEIDAPPGKRERIMAQNAEIDRRMQLLQAKTPYWHRLLDLYYRHGMCCEHDGWAVVAKRLGLEANKQSRWDRDTFEVQLAIGVERLWYAK